VLKIDTSSTVRDFLRNILQRKLANCTLYDLNVSYVDKMPIGIDTKLSDLTEDIFVTTKSGSKKLERSMEGGKTLYYEMYRNITL